MDTINIGVMLDAGAIMPTKAHKSDAGYDLYNAQEDITVYPSESAVFDTGVHFEIPSGYFGQLFSKSGLNVNFGIVGTGTIDSGFTGSVKVKLYNHGHEAHTFKKGDKLIQIVFLPLPQTELVSVSSFAETERGAAGFGSSGR